MCTVSPCRFKKQLFTDYMTKVFLLFLEDPVQVSHKSPVCPTHRLSLYHEREAEGLHICLP